MLLLLQYQDKDLPLRHAPPCESLLEAVPDPCHNPGQTLWTCIAMTPSCPFSPRPSPVSALRSLRVPPWPCPTSLQHGVTLRAWGAQKPERGLSLRLLPPSQGGFLVELLPDFSIISTRLQLSLWCPPTEPSSPGGHTALIATAPPPRADLLIGLMGFQGGGGEGGERVPGASQPLSSAQS